MKKCLVSVVIPVYNAEKFLEKCLTTVVNQDFEDYEVIIINDGSKDNSIKIIKDFMKNYSFIKLIEQENAGVSVARNRGLELSCGKYVYFLDSDDYIELNTLKLLYDLATKDDLEVVMFNGASFYDNGYSNELILNYNKTGDYREVDTGVNTYLQLFSNNEYTASPCLIFIKKETLIKNNIKFHTGIIHEDELFTFKLLLLSRRVKVINDTLFNRRIRENSIMSSGNHEKSFLNYIEVFREMLFFREQKVKDVKDIYLIQAINRGLAYIYGGILNTYVRMSKKEKKNQKNKILEIVNIGKENHFFYRKKYLLFYFSKRMYALLLRFGNK